MITILKLLASYPPQPFEMLNERKLTQTSERLCSCLSVAVASINIRNLFALPL